MNGKGKGEEGKGAPVTTSSPTQLPQAPFPLRMAVRQLGVNDAVWGLPELGLHGKGKNKTSDFMSKIRQSTRKESVS